MVNGIQLSQPLQIFVAFILVWAYISIFCLPSIQRILVPVYKKNKPNLVGFVPLQHFTNRYGIYRAGIFIQIIFPLGVIAFCTAALSLLKLSGADIYIFIFAWLGPIFIANSRLVFLYLLILGAAFIIPFLIFGSVFYGCLTATIIFSVFFTGIFSSKYVFQQELTRLENISGEYLIGTRIHPILREIRRLSIIIIPFFVCYSSVKLAMFFFNISDRNPFIVNDTSLISKIPFLVLHAIVSVRLFLGGIFTYFQSDIIGLLAVRQQGERVDSETSILTENHMNLNEKATKEKSDSPSTHPLFKDITDRLPNLGEMITFRFHTALIFFSLDIWTTLSAILNITIIPSLTIDEFTVLLAILKVPIYFIVFYYSLMDLILWLERRFDLSTSHSKTTDPTRDYADLRRDLRSLFFAIQEQQKISEPFKDYINLADNQYVKLFNKVPPSPQKRN